LYKQIIPALWHQKYRHVMDEAYAMSAITARIEFLDKQPYTITMKAWDLPLQLPWADDHPVPVGVTWSLGKTV
jgi:hypothetical protein